jgi:hypothetical protein
MQQYFIYTLYVFHTPYHILKMVKNMMLQITRCHIYQDSCSWMRLKILANALSQTVAQRSRTSCKRHTVYIQKLSAYPCFLRTSSPSLYTHMVFRQSCKYIFWTYQTRSKYTTDRIRIHIPPRSLHRTPYFVGDWVGHLVITAWSVLCNKLMLQCVTDHRQSKLVWWYNA